MRIDRGIRRGSRRRGPDRLRSIGLCFIELGCNPRHREAFENVALVLLGQAIVVVPAGTLLRRAAASQRTAAR